MASQMNDNGKKGRDAGGQDRSDRDNDGGEQGDRPVWARPDGDIDTDFDKFAERAASMAGEDSLSGEDEDWSQGGHDDGLLDDPEADTGEDEDLVSDAPRRTVPSAAETVARLEAEKAEITDRFVRTVADMDNLRKRTERELKDTRKYALAKFAGDLLSVGDNLQRALQAVTEEALESDTGPLAGLRDGVEMTARELDTVLGKHGVMRIDPAGEKFDPHKHQAMFQIDNPDLPNGTVMEVVQAGYMIGERVLRAAMVGIARGGPKEAAKEEVAPEAADETAEPAQEQTAEAADEPAALPENGDEATKTDTGEAT